MNSFSRKQIKNRINCKFLLFFFFIFCITYSTVSAQELKNSNITINVKDERITDVLKKISQLSNYKFFYDEELVKDVSPINLNRKKSDLQTILSDLTRQSGLNFIVSDNTITVSKKVNLDQTNKPRFKAKGIVKDANGESLIGVTVTEKGAKNGTVTDIDGRFILDVSPDATLLMSYIGYERKVVKATVQEMIVILEESSGVLDEVVVVGYGTMKKRDLTGAVSSVKTSDMPTGTVSSISQLLAGKAAGLRAVQSSAQVGGGVSFKIRGEASIGAGNEPLVVIDGFPVYNSPDMSSGNRYNSGNYDNILSSINPNDIESIEVLKDASATAIYGSRAGHGVIIVTTKRGTESKTNVTYSGNISTQHMKNSYDMLDAKNFMTQRNRYGFEEYIKENGLGIYKGYVSKPASHIPPQYVPYYTDTDIANASQGVDWFKEVTRNGFLQNHDVSLRGGNKATQYLASVSYMEQKGIIKNNDMARFTLRLNLDHQISKIVKTGLTVNINENKYNNTPIGDGEWENAGIISSAVRFSPLIPIYDDEGNYSLNPNVPQIPNPVSLLEITDKTASDRVMAHSYVSIEPISKLIIKANLGFDKQISKRKTYLPKTTKYGAAVNGQASISESEVFSKLMELTATYSKQIGVHNFSGLVGYSYQTNETEGFNAGNQDFVIGDFLYNNLGAGSYAKPSVGSHAATSALGSYFTRLNYSLLDRYLVTATLRADGDSNFQGNNKWGYFPSVALAWRFIDEPFINLPSDIFSNGKLRLSYGQTGNSNIGHKTLDLYKISEEHNLVFGDQGYPGVVYSQLGNPNLKWETTTEFNLGLDLGVLNNRINLSAEYFDRTISDLLGTVNLPFYHALDAVAANMGKTQSQGFEITLNTVNITQKDLYWSTDLTLSTYRDRWKERSIYWVKPIYAEVDQSIRAHYTMIADGLLQPGEKAPIWQPGLLPGQVKLKDINGDNKLDDNDVVYMGSTDPKLIFGMNNSVKYKRFDFNIYFYGESGRLRSPSYRFNWSTHDIKNEINVPIDIKYTWSSDNPTGILPSTIQSIYPNGDYQYKDNAFFIRCRNITLGYQIPVKFFEKMRAYVDVNNPFVVSNWNGVDPETSGQYTYPNVVSYNFGFEINF